MKIPSPCDNSSARMVQAVCTLVAMLACLPLGELFFFHLILIKKVKVSCCMLLRPGLSLISNKLHLNPDRQHRVYLISPRDWNRLILLPRNLPKCVFLVNLDVALGHHNVWICNGCASTWFGSINWWWSKQKFIYKYLDSSWYEQVKLTGATTRWMVHTTSDFCGASGT